MPRFNPPTIVLPFVVIALCSAFKAAAGDSDPPNLVPEMTFSYVDPGSGQRQGCGKGCRRFEVPAGVDLEIRIQVSNQGDNPISDGVDWVLWFDQPRSPFPPLDFAACFDAGHRLDTDCYHDMMDRVDWGWWDTQGADRVCLPDDHDDCLDETFSMTMDADFEGSRGRGVYSFMLWVDRLDTHIELNDFDNVAGPVRVKIASLTTAEADRSRTPPASIEAGKESVARTAIDTERHSAVFDPASPRPYAVEVISTSTERAFAVSSGVAHASIEFVPSYPGAVAVEVEQVGVWEKMTVRIRKRSTGEILCERSGKGRLRFDCQIQKVQLVDDRLFELEVHPEPGTRGLRGTVSVSYPDRAIYIRNQ